MCQKLQGVAEVLMCMIGSLHDFVANWVTEGPFGIVSRFEYPITIASIDYSVTNAHDY
jgi:hypothetical protein